MPACFFVSNVPILLIVPLYMIFALYFFLDRGNEKSFTIKGANVCQGLHFEYPDKK
jgi:hypothetical protein